MVKLHDITSFSNSLSYILVADDDLDDQELIQDAFEDNKLSSNKLKFVNDGEELIQFLHTEPLLPSIILLDLNMPKKTGKEALIELKTNRRFRHIPIIILTTSDSDIDISECYGHGSNAYVTKPNRYEDLVSLMKDILAFWVGHAHIATVR